MTKRKDSTHNREIPNGEVNPYKRPKIETSIFWGLTKLASQLLDNPDIRKQMQINRLVPMSVDNNLINKPEVKAEEKQSKPKQSIFRKPVISTDYHAPMFMDEDGNLTPTPGSDT